MSAFPVQGQWRHFHSHRDSALHLGPHLVEGRAGHLEGLGDVGGEREQVGVAISPNRDVLEFVDVQQVAGDASLDFAFYLEERCAELKFFILLYSRFLNDASNCTVDEGYQSTTVWYEPGPQR